LFLFIVWTFVSCYQWTTARRKFGHQEEEVTGEFRKLRKDSLHNSRGTCHRILCGW